MLKLNNIPFIEGLKWFSKGPDIIRKEFTNTFYEIFKHSTKFHKKDHVSSVDRKIVQFANLHNIDVKISSELNDVQLLKLHIDGFPDFDYSLVYHTDFGLYEIKNKNKTEFIFYYNNGVYQPISEIM